MHFNKGKAYGRQGKAPTRLIFAEALLLAETNLSSLNPEAPEWQGSKSVPLSEREANIDETSIKHHLSVSDKNASEMLDIQRLQQQQNKQVQELLKQQQQQQTGSSSFLRFLLRLHTSL